MKDVTKNLSPKEVEKFYAMLDEAHYLEQVGLPGETRHIVGRGRIIVDRAYRHAENRTFQLEKDY